jgi:hypothetical protein
LGAPRFRPHSKILKGLCRPKKGDEMKIEKTEETVTKIPPYGTVADIGVLLREIGQGLSERMIRRHIQTAGLTKTPKTGLYNVAKVLEAIKAHRETDNKNLAGNHGNLKSKKLTLEIEQLQLKIDEMRSLVIPVGEHLRDMREMQRHWNSTLEHFRSEASALTKDAHLLDRLETLIENTRKMLVEKIESVEASTYG